MNKKELIEEVRAYLIYFKKLTKKDKRILNAIEKIDRKDFMNKNKSLAYENEAIPIGYDQTISQPSTVARMLSLLEINAKGKVLEIGTGSAWNAALLGYLSKEVMTLERVKKLAEKSRKKIKELKIKNVKVKQKDFRKLKSNQKFDKIIFTAGILSQQEKTIKEFAKDHLKNKGILICPHRSGPLIIIKKKKNKVKIGYSKEQYNFVPLVLE